MLIQYTTVSLFTFLLSEWHPLRSGFTLYLLPKDAAPIRDAEKWMVFIKLFADDMTIWRWAAVARRGELAYRLRLQRYFFIESMNIFRRNG